VRDLEAKAEILKQEAKLADDDHKQHVLDYQDMMVQASDTRKSVALDFKARIENLRTEIRALTAKQ
jgi:hypothetical protein